jgi:RNA polymerase sigma factor (sigma-70 family)
MSPSALRAWFDSARGRWPRITWGFDRFCAHVGSDEPRHPVDMYLAGAAAERDPQAWPTIESDVRPEVLRRIHRLARRAESPEDLWQDLVVELMSEQEGSQVLADGRRPGRIACFRGPIPIGAWIAMIAKRRAIDKLRKATLRQRRRVELSESIPSPEPRSLPSEEALREAEAMARDFYRALRSLTPMRQALLSLVYGKSREGGRPLGKAEAGAMLGLRDYQVSRELSAAMESLQASLHAQDHGAEAWKPLVIEAWIRFCMEHQPHPPEDVDETP